MRLQVVKTMSGASVRRITPQTPADVELLRAIRVRAQLQPTDRLAQRRQLSQGSASGR